MEVVSKPRLQHKPCGCCGLLEEQTEFSFYKYTTLQGKRSTRRDSYCKACKKLKRNLEASRKSCARWRQRNPEYAKEYNAEYRQTFHGKAVRCALQQKRETSKLQRIPKWANLDKITEIYEKAAELGPMYHVDHIIPLQGKIVSGLHVENNLQILTAFENISKKNRYISE